MKKLFIAATMLLLATLNLNAQTPNEPMNAKHHRGTYSHKGAMQHFDMTEDQKKQMQEIRKNYHKQITELKNNKSLSAEELKIKSAALQKEQHEKMQSLLTPEQKAKMADWKKEGAKGMEGHGAWNARGQHPDQLKTRLGLSDDQSAKLKDIQSDFQNKVKAVRENKALTDNQKEDQVKELARVHHENMKSILTTGQLEKLKTERKTRSNR